MSLVLKTLKENGEKAKNLLLKAVPAVAKEEWTETIQNNQVRDHVTLCFQMVITQKVLVGISSNFLHSIRTSICIRKCNKNWR